MDWKSDLLDRAGALGDPPKAPLLFWGALRYRYKRDLHIQPRVTPPKNVEYGKYIARNVTTFLYMHVTLRVYVYVTLPVHAPQG